MRAALKVASRRELRKRRVIAERLRATGHISTVPAAWPCEVRARWGVSISVSVGRSRSHAIFLAWCVLYGASVVCVL